MGLGKSSHIFLYQTTNFAICIFPPSIQLRIYARDERRESPANSRSRTLMHSVQSRWADSSQSAFGPPSPKTRVVNWTNRPTTKTRAGFSRAATCMTSQIRRPNDGPTLLHNFKSFGDWILGGDQGMWLVGKKIDRNNEEISSGGNCVPPFGATIFLRHRHISTRNEWWWASNLW